MSNQEFNISTIVNYILLLTQQPNAKENLALLLESIFDFTQKEKAEEVRKNGGLYITLIGFALFGISIQVFMPYLIIYYNVSLEMENYVFIMAPAIILAAVFTAFWGRVYDKVKFKKSVFPALALLILGYVILYFFRGTALVFIGSLLMMCGYLSGAAVFGAVIRDCTPVGKAGRFQGLRK